MRSLVSLAAGFAALAIAPMPAEARAEDREARVDERIHSGLPLYTFEWDFIWPRSLQAGDRLGCASRVRLGDWRFTPTDPELGEESWERYGNYGALHCAAVIRVADERSELGEADWAYGFFVRMGEGRLGSKKWELWALQKGTVPGSQYILLAREAGPNGPVGSFRVLQRRCPQGRIREVRGLDVWSTRYCSIESREALLMLARRMLRRPPLGTLVRVGDPPEDDDE